VFTHVGFEQELIVHKDNQLVDLSSYGLPHDAIPYLLEIRADPAKNPLEALYRLKYARAVLTPQLRDHEILVTPETQHRLSPAEIRYLRHTATKAPDTTLSLYGAVIRVPARNVITAGFHIHFSNNMKFTQSLHDGSTQERTVFGFLDVPTIIRTLDDTFSDSIKSAGRQRGLYRIKPHGFEYRSLPTDVSFDAIVEVLDDIQALRI